MVCEAKHVYSNENVSLALLCDMLHISVVLESLPVQQ